MLSKKCLNVSMSIIIINLKYVNIFYVCFKYLWNIIEKLGLYTVFIIDCILILASKTTNQASKNWEENTWGNSYLWYLNKAIIFITWKIINPFKLKISICSYWKLIASCGYSSKYRCVIIYTGQFIHVAALFIIPHTYYNKMISCFI